MKKLFALVLLLSGSLALRADQFQDNFGIGVVHIDLNLVKDLKFYNSFSTDKLMEDLKFETSIVGEKKAKHSEAKLLSGNDNKWFEPENYDPSTILFTMRVMEKKTGWYNVMVNNRTRQTYWIRVVDGVNMNSWNDEIEFCLGITRIDRNNSPLRKAPNSNFSIPYDEKAADCFAVELVQGLWVKVKTRKECADGTTKIDEAWIKWRDEKDMFINYIPAVQLDKK